MVGEVVNTVYGPISTGFAKSPLSDLCVSEGGVQTGPFGSQLHASDYVEHGTPIITVEHLGENRIIHVNLPRVTDEDKERLSRYTLQTGDIVFSRVGSVDRRAIVHPEEHGWLFSGRCLRVRPDREKIDPGYLSWFFGLPAFKEYIRRIAVGATMPSLNTRLLSNVVVYYPQSLKAQRAIACILGALDDKIELNRRMNETLEGMAGAIFKSWFVDFDPVRAKAEGRQPPGLAPHIAELFPDAFEETELGEIPKGWKVTPLSELVQLISGGTPKRSETNYWGGDIPWFSVRDIPPDSDMFVLCTQEHITQAGVENSAAKVLPEGTTVITARGTVGKVALTGVPMAMNQSCYGVRGRDGYGYCFNYHNLRRMIATLRQRTHGSVFDTITRDTFNTVLVVAPPIALVHTYDEIVSPMLERIKSNGFATLILATLRDTLLPRLISGELRVSDADRIVGRAS